MVILHYTPILIIIFLEQIWWEHCKKSIFQSRVPVLKLQEWKDHQSKQEINQKTS